jgi:hypothetical protein
MMSDEYGKEEIGTGIVGGDKDMGAVDPRLSILDYCLWQIMADVPPVENELEWMDCVVSEALDRLTIIDNHVSNLSRIPGVSDDPPEAAGRD